MSYLILGILLMGLLILAAPISFGYDTGEPWLRIRWLGLTLKKSCAAKQPHRQKTLSQKSRTRGRAVLLRLWAKRDLCLELLQRVRGFSLGVFRTLNFRDSEAGISLPDPMWNGWLYGVVSAIDVENVSLSVNFENRNYVKIRVTVYPYRVIHQATTFVLHLPYLRLLRFAWDLKKTTPRPQS
jgi:hypothetical protein